MLSLIFKKSYVTLLSVMFKCFKCFKFFTLKCYINHQRGDVIRFYALKTKYKNSFVWALLFNGPFIFNRYHHRFFKKTFKSIHIQQLEHAKNLVFFIFYKTYTIKCGILSHCASSFRWDILLNNPDVFFIVAKSSYFIE